MERVIQINGKRYKVTNTEERSTMPWATEAVCYTVTKWELLEKPQLELFPQ